MKTLTLKLSSLLQILQRIFTSKKYRPAEDIPSPPVPLTEQAELLQVCCHLIGQTETAIRREIRNLSPHIIETIREDIIPPRNYKGLRVECEQYALWVDFSTLNGKDKQEKQRLHCLHLWLFYTGETNRHEFTKALEDENQYSPLWENCYTDLETTRLKITHRQDSHHELLPYCLYFRMFNYT